MVSLSAETLAVTINLSQWIAVPSATKASLSSYNTEAWFNVRLFKYPILYFHACIYIMVYIYDCVCPGRETWDLTLHSSVNLSLSSGWLPASPGYLQSRFIPSNPFALSSVIADWMNFVLVCSADTIVLNLVNV